ncbi:hypothetical protein ACHAXT_009546 [Thalassiosira profunda]
MRVLSLGLLPFVIGHDDAPHAPALQSVPGPPEWATLDVLGANTLQTTFAPPSLDGGSPITSYLVEWDKEAGTPEVQRIVTSQDLNSNEIQTVTTSASDVNEIQVVQTTATAQAEVQAVTVSPPAGDATIDAAYSFAVSLDTIRAGGSLQYSGQISANAAADGARSSVAQILENMANVHERPTVERSDMNPDGGHTYLVTFPTSMGNVPELEVFVSDLPISITTLQEGNALEGSFRLEFMGELTADIPHDASSAEMQDRLESLDNVGAVSVARSMADEQGGFEWEIEFLSDSNGGNLPTMIVHGDGLRTSNAVGGANIDVSTGRDGSYISGTFTLAFRGEATNPLSYDADASTVKEELEALSTVARVHVERTPLDIVGGCTWTVSFLEDGARSHRGDMPMLVVDPSLVGTPRESPSIIVAEKRKGTQKEVQTITIDGGGADVDPASSFRLRFEGEETGDILALPLGGSTCLGSTKAKQVITTSTVDTSGVGGDDSVSHLTSFALGYEGHTTSQITANGASCEDTADLIAQELMKLPPLYEVAVTGSNTATGDEGCSWVVTFLSVMGNPELMTVTASNGDVHAGPGHSVTVGDEYSIIRDTVAITQPAGFEGDANLIQSELSKLSTIGTVTVTPVSAEPDSFGQCAWEITFESKAGNVAAIEAARSGTSDFSTDAELNAGNRIIITDDTVRGTSFPVSGDFRLSFDGELTGYMPFDASPALVKSSLDALSKIGEVSVTRLGPDVNSCYTWDVTFVSDLGPLPLLVADDLDLEGTVASMGVFKSTVGALPPFDGPDYGSLVVSDRADLSVVIPDLRQGIPYYVRISASNALGASPTIMPYPPVHVPFPQPPAPPSDVSLEAEDGSTLAVSIDAPFHDGGKSVTSYRVDYSTQPFVQERQRISLTCSPEPEIQSVTTSATDIDEIQFLVLDSSYSGGGEVAEVQRIRCDATGGTFGLLLDGETAYISHDADADDIKESLESLPMVGEVSVAFNNGKTSACAPFDGSAAGDFSVTFQSLAGMAGDLPLMIAETSGLDGARHVEVTTEVDGDAPLSGSIKLSFRGAVSEAIDVSLDPSELADAIDAALEALDTVQQDGVAVAAVDLTQGGHEKIFSVEFQGTGVGGNVEALEVVPEHLLVVGSSADAFVLSDGESYAARNGVESITSLVGNELSGHFRLRLRGHTSGRIPFNSSENELKARLEELPNIGTVDVRRSGPSKEMAYTWTITFLSNPGYFPPASRDVDTLEAVSELSTSVEVDDSADVLVETVRTGDDRLSGQFRVAFDDGQTVETTRPLQSFISAEDLQMELEALPNIGRVTVVRSKSLVGYEWDVEFTSCALKAGVEVCNDGDLLSLVVSDLSLQGCGGASLAVSELSAGRGAGACPHLPSGLCYDDESFDGEYPIEHRIRELALGTPYYVQVRLRNSQSHGYRRLANPLHATPQHNPPGAPPPVALVESTSTSITVGWQKPTVNGGKVVSGYELWMDAWSGGDTFMVYDGAGSPDVMQYQLTTSDVGPHSQIVETGRQYRFQVRAINNCDADDPSRSCFGEFSEVQIFTVRDPRPPLPPSMPQRDATSRVISSDEAAISVSWAPPVDNGGSPITGYILYMRDYEGTMTQHEFGVETTTWQAESLRPGEVYRFHVVAINAQGKSGNSPVLSALAAMRPGMSYVGEPEYSNLGYRPVIVDVQEDSLATKWSHLPADIAGGSPITGFKVYLYESQYPLVHSDSDPIQEEVQHIVISSEASSVSGTFTLSFRGHETTDIAVDASADAVKAALENLPSINLLHVESIADGWSVAFLSEAGDLPLIQATSGRLSDGAKVVVAEATKGDPATLVYESDSPGIRTFEALNLTPDTGYAFKVAPVNAIGDGILSAASVVTVARAGASASKTTASGSALSRGIAGSIQEEQIVTFLSDDCTSDRLVLSFGLSDPTENLCDATAEAFGAAIEGLGLGSVHVSRAIAASPSGHTGFAWSVTFTSLPGDVPNLAVDPTLVGNGRDASGEMGVDAAYVVEFLKGQSNEFTIEPKKASGSVVRDVSTYEGMEAGDVFFSELWTSDASVLDGSHTWYSDGGPSSYSALLPIEQMVVVPTSVGTFHLSMDTSESQPWGRLDGVFAKTRDLTAVSEVILEEALSELPNVGKVDVTQTNKDHPTLMYFVVTFRDVFGEYPLLAASDPSITISRNGGQFSATEIQTVTMSVDKPFVYEVQSVSVASSSASFDLSFQSGPRTSPIACSFASVAEAQAAVPSIEAELNALPDLKVRVDTTVSGTGEDSDPWRFRVTFLEPVGPLPLLDSDRATIAQIVQGESTLQGSVVLSYEGAYTDDIPFDASPKDIKDELERLDTVEEVNVRRIDKYTGYQWVVSFTGNAGNLPLVVAHDNVFEIQSIETSGGQPTPLGGTFTLSYLSEETAPIPFDGSAELVKSSLESLPSIDHVDVSQETYEHGQSRWLVTFRVPEKPALLTMDSSSLSGTLDSASVSVMVAAQSPSLIATSGSPPLIVVEEKVPGLPSYTGQYRAEVAGNYSLAVLQLEAGGLNANYYDNQWLLENPVIERVDPTINFDWGAGIITQYGRDYVSVRWWGKVRPQTTEPYTFYLHADDGVRLFVDHELVLDLWDEHSLEKKATVDLTAGTFHDVKVEYKEITGDANCRLEWSSRSLKKQVIPSAQLFHPSHIVGSPFLTTVLPGAADYPHSDFIDTEGQDRSVAVAGDRTSFYLQAKDSSGNDKLTSGDAQGDLQSPEEQFAVEIVGDHGSTTGEVTYLEPGQYRVDYTVLKAGAYQVHVKTGGTDIYCGLGEENKCSPFALTVLPGPTLASNCEVESSFDPIDHLVEARAGTTGTLYLQAKDAFGNNRNTGGDEVLVIFQSAANSDVRYRGNVLDNEDGTYHITYSIPLAGSYLVSATVGGEPVQYCVGPSGTRWDSREYSGISVYSSPSFCSLDDDLSLNVVHRELHGVSSTLVDEGGLSGLSHAVVGVETGFVIESRDKFSNLRAGASTSNIAESGDGESDAFVVRLVGPSGHATVTSSAIQTLTSSDSSTTGYFRLAWGGQASDDLPHDISASALGVVLSSMHDNGGSSVEVSRSDVGGTRLWTVTFTSNLDLWAQEPLSILPASDGLSAVSNTMSVAKQPSAGLYPVRYTLWEKGLYELSVFSGTDLVTGSSYTVEVANGAVEASSSTASGDGLATGIAGEESTFEVSVRDRRRPEIQTIKTSATAIDFINEVQQVQVLSNAGESFQLEFRGQQTSAIEVGSTTLSEIVDALEALATVGQVDVTLDGSSVVENGDTLSIEFLTERGSLDLMQSSGSEDVTKLVEGEAPYRAERQALHCNADGGYIILSFEDRTSTIEFNDDVATVASKLSALMGHPVSLVEPDEAIATICDSAGKLVLIDFPVVLGDAEPIGVNFDALENGSLSIYGDGEGSQGAVNGIAPIMGTFTLSHEGETTAPIPVDATAEDVKAALENLSSVGSVGVTKDVVGIRQASDGQNIVPGTTSLYSIWSVTFADSNEDGCHPGAWDKCPANIGDVEPLVVDATSLTHDIGATQQQSAPSIEVYEVQKGSAGNLLEEAEGLADIQFSLAHNLVQGVGVGMQEVHELRCDALDAAGSFELGVLGKRISVDAQTTIEELKLLIGNALGLADPISSEGSTHATVCAPGTAVTTLTFSQEDGPIPGFFVHSEQNVAVSAVNLVDAVDSVEYLGGRYLVSYTPTISGHYSASVQINDEYLWTDLSAGVVVNPAKASAHHCTHDSSLVAVAGTEESFAVVARDRFGNELLSNSPGNNSLVTSLEGVSDVCGGAQRQDSPIVAVKELEVSSAEGHYEVAYTPILAGVYQSSIRLRSRGGLLATYFRNEDFSQPVYGNNNHNSPPYHETPWCASDSPACDSTRLDEAISFDWGLESPLAFDPTFPIDSFSVAWEGELQVDSMDEYKFTVRLDGGARLTIGEQVVLDNLRDASAELVSSEPVALTSDEFYPIKLEYAHSIDEAHIQLLWESSSMERQAVPSSVLFYTRHMDGVTSSPYSVNVAPGAIDVASVAQGDGLEGCVSLEECSFVVQTKDAHNNNRHNDGSSPGLEISIVGTEGWAGEGVVNSVATADSPIEVSGITVEDHDWLYLGEADVTHLSESIATTASFVGSLLRGDHIVIDGTIYIVAAEGSLDATTVPLASPYLGPTKTGVSVYKVSKSCRTGQHTVKYTPSVRGTYEMDVKLPSVSEVQRVTTSGQSHSSLTGSFSLSYQDVVSDGIDFDASAEDVKLALESIETLGSVAVALHECANPAVSCSWDVTFSSIEGDADLLVPNTAQLGGDVSDVRVEELVKGRQPKSIAGFPRTLEVSPGETDPSSTTAYGRGLAFATAGEEATFAIQPKDAFGNDRLAEQDADLFAVFVYPEGAEEDGSFPVTRATVRREAEGFYSVSYVPETSGYHTVAIVHATSTEQQSITTGYNTKARGGTFAIKLGNLSTAPIPWDASADLIKTALDSSMSSISTFGVDKTPHGLLNFRVLIRFEAFLGDVPDFAVDTSNLVGNAKAWEVESLADGEFAHIKLPEAPTHEISAVNLEVLDLASVAGATFSLAFKGQRTDPIAWDADAGEMQAKLETLSTVGDIAVSLDVDEASSARSFRVTFDPYEGKSANSLANFGNLPQLEVSSSDASISVSTETVEDGSNPFRLLVSPAEPASKMTTAQGEGLSSGVYKSDATFVIQSRDAFSNEIQDGPLREVQVIETSASSQIGGYFEVSIFNATVRVPASAFTSELEKSLQSIPGVGSVDVSSNSAKDLVAGKTVAATKGLATITPSEELTEFFVGDWIRIGDQDEGGLFAIIDMADVAPFTVTLSSPYLGDSDSSLSIYQHGSPGNRLGYRYIVAFDSALGDLPQMEVDGALLDGDDATIEVISCDWNVHQSLRTHAAGTTPIDGHFSLLYGDEETRLLSFDSSAEDLESAILSDITSIHSLSITHEQDHGLGENSWSIHLLSYDGDARLLFAEGHLLSGGTVAVTPVCPVASPGEPLHSVETVAGRRGQEYVVSLSSEEQDVSVHGGVRHLDNARYLATYTTPRVGQYALSVLAAQPGGLWGAYYQNRWLADEPVATTVDAAIDFVWSKNDPIAPGAKDFVSVRWTGYVKPSFDEVYSFTTHVNDGVRLWIGNDLLIDAYDNEVDDADEYAVFSANTTATLRANQLTAIKIEFRENRGMAVMRLFWESLSQPFAIIDSSRLYSSVSHIRGSPYAVSPQAIEPTSPTSCSLSIADWDALQVDWSSPNDDGGSAVTAYQIEHWDASDEDTTHSLEVEATEVATEDGSFAYTLTNLVQPSGVADGFGVRVSAGTAAGYGPPCPAVFLKPSGLPLPPQHVEIERVASDPSSLALHWTSVSDPEDRGAVVTSYFIEWSTSGDFGDSENTTLSAELVQGKRLSSYDGAGKVWNFHTIEDLTPGEQYFVRIASTNEAGTGPSSRPSTLSLAPGSKPSELDDGVSVSTLTADATVSVAESSSTLRVSWRAPSSDNGFAVSSYLLESWIGDDTEEVQEIAVQSSTSSPIEGTFTLSYEGDKTGSLSIDSSAEDVQTTLEGLSTLRSVRVWRSGENSWDRKWIVTFASEYPSVYGQSLTIEDSTELLDASGEVPTLQVEVLTPGVLPTGYSAVTIAVEDPLQTAYTYDLTDLTAGQMYQVQVSVANSLGYGPPQASLPRELAPPVQKPSSPTNVILSVASSQSLEVVFSKPESDGGDGVSLYRIEHDPSPAFDSLDGAPLGSYSFVSPKDGVGCDPCIHQITGLVKGTPYFVRVYSYNAMGYSVEPGLPSPLMLSPKTTPEPPEVLDISPQSDTSIQVAFSHTLDDGGAPVSTYKVEWNAMGYHAGMPSTNGDHTALLYSPHNVQSITVTAEKDDLGGTFRLAFEGHATEEVSAKATANDLKLALEALPTVGSAVVSRGALSNGFVWAVTFLTNRGHLSQYGPIELLGVSTDAADLPSAFVADTQGGSLLGTGARIVVNEEVTAFKGYEQQTLTTQCATSGGILGGHFALSFEGVMTTEIPPDASHHRVKSELENIASVGTVKVARRKIHDRVNAFEWTVVFLDRLGNVPLLDVHDHLTCSDASAGPHIYVTETVQGVLPRMDGPLSGSVELDAADYAADEGIAHTIGGLLRGMQYHFRVSAWNGAGDSYGRTQHSLPAILVPMDRPDPPLSVEMTSIDNSTLRVSWDASLLRRQEVVGYKVELDSHDEIDSFDVANSPEVQMITLESTADDMGGTFAVRFMGQSSASIKTVATEEEVKQALEGISTIDDVDVSITSHSQDESTPNYGQRWIVTFTSQGGNLPSLLLDTGSAPPCTIATGGTIFGSSSILRVETESDGGLPTTFVTPSTLSSSKSYTTRVYSYNGHSWSNPVASRYALSPSKVAPSRPQDVRVNVLSDTELGVSWTQPVYSGGSPLSSYRVEWDSDTRFDLASSTVSHVAGEGDYYSVIDRLDPLESYFVRVMAYTASGFSEPEMAVPLLANTRQFEIALVETTGAVDYSETFVVETSDGKATNALSVLATSREVEDELNTLGIYGAISVDREDRSSAFDSSGIETHAFDIRYMITLFDDDDDVTLSVNGDALGSIVATVEEL